MNKFIYELVTMDTNGRLHTMHTDLLSIQALVSGVETNRNLRTELQGQPKLAGYCGPMWGGTAHRVDDKIIPEWVTQELPPEAEPIAIIRYETQTAYNSLSQ